MTRRRTTIQVGAAEESAWQLQRLQQAGMLRSNPSKKKNVPSYIKETPRSAAKGVSVFPRRKEAWPIGDLFHARLALIYAMAPTHRPQIASVIQAVGKYYPEYKWAGWWSKETKKRNAKEREEALKILRQSSAYRNASASRKQKMVKDTLKKVFQFKTWGSYLKHRVSRAGRGSWEQSDSRTKHRNPFTHTGRGMMLEPDGFTGSRKKLGELAAIAKRYRKSKSKSRWARLVKKHGMKEARQIVQLSKQFGWSDSRKNPAKGLTAWQKFVRKEAKAAKAAGKKTPSVSVLSKKYHREEATKCKVRHGAAKKKTTKKKAPAKKKTTAKGKGKRPSKTAYLKTRAPEWNDFQKEMGKKYPGMQSGEMGDMWQKIKDHRAKKRKK